MYSFFFFIASQLQQFTMKLFFREKFHCDLMVIKMGRFELLNFDFVVFDFDTMKFILFAKVLKSLVLIGF